ncbi:MAG: gamma-glutamyltransferase family protein, partial [Candidatus Latescibacteria bacterium]|nr:gamma-glutamyltransferase family protein [Candidatus Latescibacterota bacterium]
GVRREYFLKDGIPARGMAAALVPGEIDAYAIALDRYGTMSFAEVLQPAINYAEQLPVSERFSGTVKGHTPIFSMFPSSAKVFLSGGRPPEPGDIFVQRDLARTLRMIAEGGRDAFYRGEIARAIVRFSREHGGFFEERDFSDYQAQLLDPIVTTYRGYTVYEHPLVSQGFIVLEAMNIVEGFDLPSIGHETADGIHLLVEAVKVAFADRYRYVGDPDFVDVPIDNLLSKDYAAERRMGIDRRQIGDDIPVGPAYERGGDTTYFIVADGEGNIVSVVQSLWNGFGAAVVPEGTGILLSNRMTDFSLKAGDPNCLAPGKMPVFTLNSFMVFKDGWPVFAGGTPGDYGQVQWNLQMISSVIDGGLGIREAVETPKWRYQGPDGLSIGDAVPEDVRMSLATWGHRLMVSSGTGGGNLAIITVDPTSGMLTGIADPRGDGCPIGW